jgi:hypothetical protein
MGNITLEILLTPDEAERITEFAEEIDTGPEELLARFVADLTYSDRSGDREDSERAEHWLSGCKHRIW